ncbi:hypothetical protein DFLDMN_004184 [Cupriavidus sp. H19C3]
MGERLLGNARRAQPVEGDATAQAHEVLWEALALDEEEDD